MLAAIYDLRYFERLMEVGELGHPVGYNQRCNLDPNARFCVL